MESKIDEIIGLLKNEYFYHSSDDPHFEEDINGNQCKIEVKEEGLYLFDRTIGAPILVTKEIITGIDGSEKGIDIKVKDKFEIEDFFLLKLWHFEENYWNKALVKCIEAKMGISVNSLESE